jgi:PAS domain S-box-containing protein
LPPTSQPAQLLYDWNTLTDSLVVNGDVDALLGRTPSELQNLAGWRALIEAEDVAMFDREVARFRRDRGVFELSYRMRRTDGEWVVVEEIGRYVSDADGGARMIGFVRDITQRRNEQAALHEAQRQLRENARFVNDILNSLPAHVLVLAQDGTIIAANESWRAFARRAVTRSGETAFLGENFIESCGAILRTSSPVTVKEASNAVRAVISGTVEHYSFDYQPDGSEGERWYSLRVTRLEGIQPGAVLSHEDVTDRKEAATELQRQAGFARYNPNPVLELSPEAAVTFANKAAVEMARGFRREGPRDILPENTPALVSDCLLSGKPLLRLEHEIEGRIMSWSFFPVPAAECVHCYGGDITERKRLEEQFRHAQKMEAIGHLSGGIAHDFNNLLTVIQAHVGLLRTLPLLDPDASLWIDGIAEASERAANLTRQLLTFSRKQPIQLHGINLNEVVQGMAKLLNRILGEDIRPEYHYTEGPAMVLGDAGMIEQVLMNLAVNARDAMPAGGTLSISVALVETARPRFPSNFEVEGSRFIRLTVTDSGCGIANEDLPHIFDPFFTTKPVGKGTGLGLATVYGIVQQHDGWIDVQSRVGHGTSFKIYFPRSTRVSETPELGGEATDAPNHGHEAILLVEDESMVRNVVERVLKQHGYRVHAATNAPEALKLWEAHRREIRLLLTDVVMPGNVDGRELAQRLMHDSPDLRVVYMTGYHRDTPPDDTPVDDNEVILPKPFDGGQLTRIIRASLDAANEPELPLT